MRRTITTLMFLAVGGLAFGLSAADHSRGTSNWQYYGAAQGTYRISDEDEGEASASSSTVAQAVGQQQSAGQEQNALYVTDGMSPASGIRQTNFFESYGGGCGCNQGSCYGGCNNCGCSTNGFRLEWLGWFTRGRNTPPLVSTSPVGTARTDAGVLGLDTTTVLYGNDPIGTNLRNGGRLTFDHLFADGITTGTARFWGIEDGSETFTVNSTNNPIIARPFFNTALGIQDSFLVAFPGVTSPGTIKVLSKNDLIGADAWISRSFWCDDCTTVDWLAGYQFSRLDDSVVINTQSISVDPGATVPIGSAVTVLDSFRTRNEFHGGSFGLIGRSYRGAVTLEALGKIGLGNMHQVVITNGSSSISTPAGQTATSATGLLTQPSNSGSFSRNLFTFVPELNANLLYNVTDNWRLLVGYTFIYWNNVVLAGNQIDTNVPIPFQAGSPVPAVKFQRTDFWVQGISLGADYRW
jgi:Putative beta barrel porin-7 (BBP7)